MIDLAVVGVDRLGQIALGFWLSAAQAQEVGSKYRAAIAALMPQASPYSDIPPQLGRCLASWKANNKAVFLWLFCCF